MKNINISKTKSAFLILLIHLVYIALFAVFMLIASLLEAPCNNDGIYVVFAGISIALLCFYPLAATGINIISIIFQVLALRGNESKVKNLIMMAVAILYEIAVIAFFIRFWQGAMGV